MSSKLLLVLTGKTASGKDTVIAELLKRYPDFKKVVTTTSRPPRPGEVEGVDYKFVIESDFRLQADHGDFIEYVEYGGNLYGTEKFQILENLNTNLIWKIDPSRAGQVKEFIQKLLDESTISKQQAEQLLSQIVVIYLTVEDEVVLKRLHDRGLDQQAIDKRMEEDKKFWQQYQRNYDFVVENVPGSLEQTVDKISAIIENRLS